MVGRQDAGDRLGGTGYADRPSDIAVCGPGARGDRGAQGAKSMAVDGARRAVETPRLCAQVPKADLAVDRPVVHAVDAGAREFARASAEAGQDAGSQQRRGGLKRLPPTRGDPLPDPDAPAAGEGRLIQGVARAPRARAVGDGGTAEVENLADLEGAGFQKPRKQTTGAGLLLLAARDLAALALDTEPVLLSLGQRDQDLRVDQEPIPEGERLQPDAADIHLLEVVDQPQHGRRHLGPEVAGDEDDPRGVV